MKRWMCGYEMWWDVKSVRWSGVKYAVKYTAARNPSGIQRNLFIYYVSNILTTKKHIYYINTNILTIIYTYAKNPHGILSIYFRKVVVIGAENIPKVKIY